MNQTNTSHNGNCTTTSLIQNDDDRMEVDTSEDCVNSQNCPNIMECPNIPVSMLKLTIYKLIVYLISSLFK